MSKRGKKREMYVMGWDGETIVDGDGSCMEPFTRPPPEKRMRQWYNGGTPGDIINVYRLVVCERYKVLANGKLERLTKPGREAKR